MNTDFGFVEPNPPPPTPLPPTSVIATLIANSLNSLNELLQDNGITITGVSATALDSNTVSWDVNVTLINIDPETACSEIRGAIAIVTGLPNTQLVTSCTSSQQGTNTYDYSGYVWLPPGFPRQTSAGEEGAGQSTETVNPPPPPSSSGSVGAEPQPVASETVAPQPKSGASEAVASDTVKAPKKSAGTSLATSFAVFTLIVMLVLS